MMKSNCECNCSCNHNPNDSNSTLIMLSRRVMVFPPEFDFFCTNCNEVFKFKKNQNGEYCQDSTENCIDDSK